MCLSIWRGLNSGPYMHSLHFCYSLGALIAPLLVTPFLSHNDGKNWNEVEARNESSVGIFYVVIGSLTFLAGLGFLYFALDEIKAKFKEHGGANRGQQRSDSQPDVIGARHSWNVIGLVGIMALFFFTYCGMEVLIGSLLASFVVNSDLQMSKVEGAHLTAVYWGTFALMRFLAIFASTK